MPLFPSGDRHRVNGKEGFSFIELMVTITILSAGIVGLYKILLSSLDRMDYLTHRIYATILLDNKISRIERMLRVYKALPVNLPREEKADVGSRLLTFQQEVNISEVEDLLEVFRVDIGLTWSEGGRSIHLGRSAYIADYGSGYEN